MFVNLRRASARLGSLMMLGLFLGRVASELWAAAEPGNGGIAPAVLITAVALLLAALAGRALPHRDGWPWLLLILYVAFPDPSPQLAMLAAGVTALTWVQVHARRREIAALPVSAGALLTGLAFFVLYVATVAPDVLPADSGEFQVVSTNLGVAHPPGFPLYTLLGHAVTRLPLPASAALKLNLFSAVTSTLTLMLVYLTVFHLTRRHLASLTAAASLGTAATFWAQATTTNIRSLTGLFAALFLYTAVRYWQTIGRREERSRPAPDRHLTLVALALGFGITHHASLLFLGFICGLFLLWVDPSLLRYPRRWSRPLLAGALGLVPLLYLPLRANASVRGASPALATLNGFLGHALALGFRGDLFYFVQPAWLWQRLKIMGDVMAFQFALLLLAGMAAGLLLMLRCDRKLAFLMGGGFVLHTLITAMYRAPQTVEYMLPAYIPAVLCLGYAVGRMPSIAGQQRRAVMGAASMVIAAVLLMAALHQGLQNYPSYARLHHETAARNYAGGLLADAPPDTVILADWHWATPLWYIQEVEGQRPDIEVQFVFPTAESYGETWARRIAEESARGRPVISTHFDQDAFAALPPAEPVGDAFLFRQEPRVEVPAGFTPLDVTLGGAIRLLGYQLGAAEVEIGQEVILTLAWQPLADLPVSTSFFAHLVGQDGRLYAQQDPPARPQPDGVTLTQFRLTPRLGAAPGDYALLVGAYGAEPLLDQNGEPRTRIATLAVTGMSRPPFTQHLVYRTLAGTESAQRLAGYDWDHTIPGRPRLYLHWLSESGYMTEVHDITAADAFPQPAYIGPWGIIRGQRPLADSHPEEYYVPFGQGVVWIGMPIAADLKPSPGQVITLEERFGSSQPLFRDLVVSVRLIGFAEDGSRWAWWDLEDSIPALGAMPSLKWIAGSRVRSPHIATVDSAAYPGQEIGVALGLYDAFTQRPLPILDERFTGQFQWVPAGRTSASAP